MDLVYEPERPALTEVLGVLLACALILYGLVKLDASMAGKEAERARETLAEQAKAKRTPVSDRVAHSHRTDSVSLGDRGPIVLPVGSAWSGGTSSAVAHTKYERAPGAGGTLSRTVAPVATSTPSMPAAPPLVRATLTSQPAAPAAPVPAPDDGPPPALLALFAASGIIMSLAGTALLLKTP